MTDKASESESISSVSISITDSPTCVEIKQNQQNADWMWNNSANMKKLGNHSGRPLVETQSFKPNVNNRMVVLFDWDDTLFPSSFLLPIWSDWVKDKDVPTTHVQAFFRLNSRERELMHMIENAVLDLVYSLLVATKEKKQQLHLFIISNSQRPWVSLTCELFFPKLYRVLFEKEYVHVIHAGTLFRMHTTDTCEWKCRAFEKVLRPFVNHVYECPSQTLEVLVMGDSDDEHNAIRLFMTEETRKHNNNVSTLPGQVVTDDNNSNNDDDTVALDRIKIKMIVLKLYPTLSQLNH